MSWLKKDLALLSRTAEEEFYEALAQAHDKESAGDGTGEEEHGEWLHASEEGSTAHGLALHRAAFDGNLEELAHLLPSLSLRQKIQLDSQGNTALHVAVLRRQYGAIHVLLEGGVPADVKNERMWNPIDEAVALRDAEAAKVLYTRLLADAKKAKRAKKEQLVKIMEQHLPDFEMQLAWQLGSPLFGLLLKHYAPSDTYKIWKVGNLLRVDGTLMGIDDKKRTLIPRWKRGHFSLLVNGGATPTAAYLVDHTTRTYYDLYRERKAHLKSIDVEVAEMIAEGAGKVRMVDADVDFQPVKTWLGRQATEKVEGWDCEVYEASGSLVAATWQKAPVVLPPDCSFEEYLTMELPADVTDEMPLAPGDSPPAKPKQTPPAPATPLASSSSMGGGSPRSSGDPKHASFSPAPSSSAFSSASSSMGEPPDSPRSPRGGGGGGGGSKKKSKTFSSRCWLARHYPISLAHVIPLLEVVAAGNKHFAQAASYLRQFESSEETFPVKVQVPLMWTVYLQLAFRHFVLLGPDAEARQPGFFELPPGYSLDRMEEGDIVAKKAEPLLERFDSGTGLPAAAPFDLRCSLDGLLEGPLAQPSAQLPLGSAADAVQGWAAAAAPGGTAADLGSTAASALGLGAAGLLPADALQQLAALQQQQALAQALSTDPLLSLTNLIAAQQGLSARVQELLLLKHQLQAVVPQRTSGIRGTGPLANPLYKTELCRSWEETGSCRYGAKCQFAHGREELRPVVRHPKYKTEVCRTFAQSGTCPYGTRCRFIHSTMPGSPAVSARAGSTTPSANGASTPPAPSRDASYGSLSGLGGPVASPATPPLAAFVPTTPSTPAPGLLPGATVPASPAGLAGLHGLGLGTTAVDASTLAALLSLQGAAAGYGTSPTLGGGYGTPTAAASPYNHAATFGQAAYGQTSPAANNSGVLEALTSLLGGSSVPSPVATPPLTAAAGALGVVGPPAGLSPIGTTTAASRLAAVSTAMPASLQAAAMQGHFPSAPGTPAGPAAAPVMRRSISDSDPSTPGGSLKRLPIFEALIHEEGGPRASSAGPTAGCPAAGCEAGRRSTSFDSIAALSAC
ncbi:Ankyrin repeat domain-containing 13C isoform B [Chlorella sorokiniana]|uniref:Ankyrin repeat domain-containing 13C isoform B n=1 Tax=Chlorella sorokiniana TaxID=3076 RepID=A0A2P6THR3_CHLSO|nr:Ankyrin repeat domain-containing 13C isoform B [Chlorella sorokiniana]|eukprot:PRW33819.1 Ankyrin repeat domain-containing 13C isoform B [Chlorella sorokiniana]